MRAAFVALLLLSSTSARAERAAVLPLEAKGVLSGASEQLDAALRKAVSEMGLEVQDVEQTRRHITEATDRGLGEECAQFTDACAVRVGILAEVDVVVTAFVEVIEERMVMRASRHVVSGKSKATRAAAIVALPAVDGGKKIDALVSRLFTGKGEMTQLPFLLSVAPPEAQVEVDGASRTAGTLWLAPGPHTLRVHLEGYVPHEQPLQVKETGEANALSVSLEPEASQTMLYVGASTAGIGGLLFAVGALATAGIEGVLQAGLIADGQRDVVRFAGGTGIVVAGTGVALAAVGGGIALMELSP